MKYLFAFAILSFAPFAYSSAVVSIDGKPYSVTLQEFEPRACPEDGPSGPEWSAMVFIASSGFSNSYNIAVGKCRADCNDDADCQRDCVSDEAAVQRHKNFAMNIVFKLFRDFPPSRQSEFCAAARNICERKCSQENAFDAQTCMIGCNQYHAIFDK